ncbi:MAG TPA: bacterial transcriptional activator domain-containing protein [Caldilineaceae bacterium]|nr:bacterial transcriptional activator domain-containing protein [Caldilineaceae bacterium]
MLKARFFGIPQISFGTDGDNVSLTGRVQALFTYLCVMREPQDRNKLADLLWDHQSEQEAKRNLRYVLRDLRKVIGDYLIVDGQTVAFHFALPHWFDITSFTTYLAPSMHSASTQVELGILQELLNLYTGDFLASFYIQEASNFERWMIAQRRHFRDAMIYGLQLATQQHLVLGEYDAGLALNQYLLTLEPWREEAHRHHMILLAASGQRSAALMQYELCCQILEEELDVPPMNETTSLYTQIKSGMWFVERDATARASEERIAIRAYPQLATRPMTAKPTSAVPAKPERATHRVDLGSMPNVGHFVGRKRELAALRQWLEADTCQLAAILGLGGQGKSTLAACFVQEQLFVGEDGQGERLPTRLPSDLASDGVDRHRNGSLPLSQGGQHHITDTENRFTQIIWRSLKQKPSCVELVQDWIQQLKDQRLPDLPTNLDQLITMLFTSLEQHRCLLVLDGAEAVLQHTNREEQVLADAYEHFFSLFIERQHRSCLLLTSRFCPTMLSHPQTRNQLVHVLDLEGLSLEDSKELLKAKGLAVNSTGLQNLHQQYAGSPGLLSQAAELIHSIFDGDVVAFAQEEIYFVGDIGSTIADQVVHLSALECQVLRALATAVQPLLRQTLWATLPQPMSKQAYYEALQRLQRAHLIQQTEGHFRIAPLLATYLAERAHQQ